MCNINALSRAFHTMPGTAGASAHVYGPKNAPSVPGLQRPVRTSLTAGCLLCRPSLKRRKNRMQNEDPRKRPLLTPQQLQLITRAVETKKGTRREEFEKLFRKPLHVRQ